jgi:hypothetical protein
MPEEVQQFDLESLENYTGEAVEMEIDPDADAFAAPAPPDDGTYAVKLRLNKRGAIEQTVTGPNSKNPGTPYWRVNLELEIVDPDGPFDGRKLFDSPTTINQANTGTNAIAGVLKELGVAVPPRPTDVELVRLLGQQLLTEPSIGVKGRWEAGYKSEDGWKTVVRGQKNFPPILKDGEVVGYQSSFDDETTEGNTVNAQFSIQRYLSQEKLNAALEKKAA